MKKILVLFMMAIFMLSTISAVMGTKVLSEERITTDTSEQYDPAIYGDIVVWYDYRKSNWDIYGYNLKTKEEFQITTNTSSQVYPAIYGDIVVWHDTRKGNADIYGYNLKTKEEFQITTDTSVQAYPAIYCDRVVWEDYRNVDSNIYLAYLDVVCRESKNSFPMQQFMKILGFGQKD
ncbi:MAG: hypothetical protein GKC01_04190 [Candidatus Methanofastidiosa archaeon]|nr:hypothetical protein [Candidatus Methanofastidiosa archaeon]